MGKNKEYAMKLTAAINEVFNDESDNHIPIKELMEGDNLTEFFHALSNIMPALIYEQFTKQGLDLLEFNHVANKLCFQYLTKE